MEIGLLMLGGGFVAGTFGSLLGLGGGVLIVPLLTIGFGLPVREAVAVSLISVVMTSGASAAVYLERDVANLRLGMFLELFTALGAVIGGGIAFVVDQQVVAALFALLMLYVAVTMARSALARPRASAPEPELAPEPDAPDLIPAVAVAAAGPARPATTGPEKD
ncbi:MAG TPA: sulfite exporter TauE/SafE family protein, partial [Candidatus Limnocylindrales bacterium]|nr:sulfite exporter TauE/SafE family protein [Candidatus Limnocylindrales bacterium]